MPTLLVGWLLITASRQALADEVFMRSRFLLSRAALVGIGAPLALLYLVGYLGLLPDHRPGVATQLATFAAYPIIALLLQRIRPNPALDGPSPGTAMSARRVLLRPATLALATAALSVVRPLALPVLVLSLLTTILMGVILFGAALRSAVIRQR